MIKNSDRYKKIWFWAVVLIILLAGILRFRFLNGSLEYDEIWSWEYFADLPVSQILTDFSVPNNHPLNTIFLKYFFDAERLWVGRLATFVSGLLSVAVAGMIARRMFNAKVAIVTMLFCALSPQLIRYGYPARGYGMQLLFILLFCYFAIHVGASGKIYPVCLLISGVLALNTISTSLMFLFIPGLFAGLVCLENWQKKEYRSWMICLTVFALYAFAFLYVNFETLQKAKEFGEALSWQSYPGWLSRTLYATTIFTGLIMFAVKPDRKTAMLLGFIVFPLTLALFSNGSPPRVWLPAVVASYMICSRGILLLPRIPAAAAMAAVFIFMWNSGNRFEWKHIEWKGIFDELKSVNGNTAIVYGANESYPLARNCKKIAMDDYFHRIMYHGSNRYLMMVNCDNHIDGIDSDCNVIKKKIDQTPQRITGKFFTGERYALTPVNGKEDIGAWLVLIIKVMPEKSFEHLLNVCREIHPDLLMLNTWLTFGFQHQNTRMRFGMFAFQKNLRSGDFFKFAGNYPQTVSIYAIESPAVSEK